MKKISIIAAGIFLFSCSSDDPAGPSREELARIISETLEEHATLLDDVIIEGRIITGNSASVHSMTLTVQNRDSYLAKMNDLTGHVYNDALEGWSDTHERPIDPAPQRSFEKLRSYLLPIPIGMEDPNSGGTALDLFSAEVKSRLGSGQGKVSLMDHTAVIKNGVQPAEQFSLNYDAIKSHFERLEEIILTTSDVAEMDAGIQELRATTSPEEFVLISLLLPAVQKVRASSQPYNELINGLFDFNEGQRHEWDRDVRRAALIAAMNFIISPEYDPTDDATSAFYVNRQIYDAIMIMVWWRAYDLYR